MLINLTLNDLNEMKVGTRIQKRKMLRTINKCKNIGWNNKATNNPADVLKRSDTTRAKEYAAGSGIITVLNYCTPNQPIKFENDPLEPLYPNGRTEDGIIARKDTNCIF